MIELRGIVKRYELGGEVVLALAGVGQVHAHEHPRLPRLAD
jgi:hypothetical protein